MGYNYGDVRTSFNGVANYVQDKYKHLLEKKKDFNQTMSSVNKLMREYLNNKDLPVKNSNQYYAWDYNAKQVQKDFQDFVRFLKAKSDINNNE